MRELKNLLYEQVSRIGKALASPKRLELIELLCQSEKTVEMLSQQADISVKLASAHLKELRTAEDRDFKRRFSSTGTLTRCQRVVNRVSWW